MPDAPSAPGMVSSMPPWRRFSRVNIRPLCGKMREAGRQFLRDPGRPRIDSWETSLILSGFTAAALALTSASFSVFAADGPPTAPTPDQQRMVTLASGIPTHSLPTDDSTPGAADSDKRAGEQKGAAPEPLAKTEVHPLLAL